MILLLLNLEGGLVMNKDQEIKVIRKKERIRETDRSLQEEGDLEVRMAMARELQDMGLKTESIERILSIRITSRMKTNNSE